MRGDRGGARPGVIAKRIVALASVLVPGSRRDRWRREWEAELWHRERELERLGASGSRVAARLIGPALGAFAHAVWLRAGNPGLAGIRADASFATRSVSRSPVFSSASALMLALGIAVMVVAFAVVRGALWVPYPYASPDGMAAIVARDAERPGDALPLAYPEVEALGASGVLESVAAYEWDPFNLRLPDRTEWVGGGVVSASFFSVLGVAPVMGRFFVEGEDRPGSPAVVVVGEALWHAVFGGRDIVGETLWLDGVAYEVVGIAPGIADLPEGAELWVPLRPSAGDATMASRGLRAIGRLAPGVSTASAASGLEALDSRLASAFPEFGTDRGIEVVPLREYRTSGVRRALIAMPLAAGLLLLIVCANLTGLFLARSATRRQELAVRRALGASGGRLAGQLMMEGLLVAGAGGILGLVLGGWAAAALVRLVPERPAWFDPSIDASSALLVVVLALGIAVLFGMAQVFGARSSRIGVASVSDGRRTVRSRGVLVFAEVALTTVLLVGSVLLVRSLLALGAVDPGFDAARRIAGTLQLPADRYGRDEDVIAFATRLIERIEAAPGIESAAIVTRMPFRSGVNPVQWRDDAQSGTAYVENPPAELNSVTAGYFETMGIALRSGRAFDASDRDGPPVVVIGETFAREHFGGRDPVGRRIAVGRSARFFEIVGVVGDVKPVGLDREPRYQVYAPFPQRPTQRMTVVVRQHAGAATVGTDLRRIVRDMDPDLAVSGLARLDESVRQSVWQLRLLTRVFWASGLFAVLLAAVGIFGIVAQAVARRTREIGIRMAIGAGSARIIRHVALGIGRVIGAGLIAGALAAFLALRLFRFPLYGVDPGDPRTYAGVVAGVALVGALAAWLPARRAVAVDPARALRAE